MSVEATLSGLAPGARRGRLLRRTGSALPSRRSRFDAWRGAGHGLRNGVGGGKGDGRRGGGGQRGGRGVHSDDDDVDVDDDDDDDGDYDDTQD